MAVHLYLFAVILQILIFFRISVVIAVRLAPGLSDPSLQPIFVEHAPNALDDNYKAKFVEGSNDTFRMSVGHSTQHYTGLKYGGDRVNTEIFGYGQNGDYLWPGLTFEVKNYRAGGPNSIKVIWENNLQKRNHILPVDTSIHWAFSLHGYENYTIEKHGIPIVPHLHGGKTDFEFDGHPESFWTPDAKIVGPFWNRTEKNFSNVFVYENTIIGAGNLWYHDHTLGITRLNVYAGMAGFYFIRDEVDTGDELNSVGLPYGDFELAYMIQDRMFSRTGELFFPAFPGDPTYKGYIDDEDVELPGGTFPRGGPTALAEFFGDHIVVNGRIWPKVDVKRQQYRIHLLNGCDSRYLVLQFMIVSKTVIDPSKGRPLEFTVIGAGNGLGTPRTFTKPLVIEPAGRYDIVIDFSKVAGQRVILHNLGGDTPFNGAFGDDLSSQDYFKDRQTDKIMAFDVEQATFEDRFVDRFMPHEFREKLSMLGTPSFDPFVLHPWEGVRSEHPRSVVRKLALFEGKDRFGRIQPLLGTATEDPQDPRGLYAAYMWSDPITEKPKYRSTETWYLINFTSDAHAMHIHLAPFEVVGEFTFTYTVDGEQDVVDYMGGVGSAPRIVSTSKIETTEMMDHYYYDSPKDVFTVLPGNPDELIGHGSIIRVKFPKMGIYEWHCHILSHEDHEMMREFEVV